MILDLIMKIIGLTIFLLMWYTLCYTAFIQKDSSVKESPQLRARLGTILSHSSDKGGEEHLYCYYPKGEATYSNKRGEYIIKRAQNLEDCRDWFGAVVFYEGAWVSEREKIWWSKSQKVGDDLVNSNAPDFNI